MLEILYRKSRTFLTSPKAALVNVSSAQYYSFIQALRNLRSSYRKLINTFRMSKGSSFIEFYAAEMGHRVKRKGHKKAVGGDWDLMGTFQLDMCKNLGLKPDSTLLDFGCGALRGGVKYINFIGIDNYYGVDISRAILDHGLDELRKANLDSKKPNIKLINDLEFNYFGTTKFDFILAQSVLTHLPETEVKLFLTNVSRVMHQDTILIVTILLSENGSHTPDLVNYYYTREQIFSWSKERQLILSHHEDIKHPRHHAIFVGHLQANNSKSDKPPQGLMSD